MFLCIILSILSIGPIPYLQEASRYEGLYNIFKTTLSCFLMLVISLRELKSCKTLLGLL